jgi:hypothetical protein
MGGLGGEVVSSNKQTVSAHQRLFSVDSSSIWGQSLQLLPGDSELERRSSQGGIMFVFWYNNSHVQGHCSNPISQRNGIVYPNLWSLRPLFPFLVMACLPLKTRLEPPENVHFSLEHRRQVL